MAKIDLIFTMEITTGNLNWFDTFVSLAKSYMKVKGREAGMILQMANVVAVPMNGGKWHCTANFKQAEPTPA